MGMNNSAVEWSIIGYISVVGSSLNIVYGLYRYFYFNIHLGYQLFDAPFDLGSSENIGVSRSVEMKTQGTKDGFIQGIQGVLKESNNLSLPEMMDGIRVLCGESSDNSQSAATEMASRKKKNTKCVVYEEAPLSI